VPDDDDADTTGRAVARVEAPTAARGGGRTSALVVARTGALTAVLAGALTAVLRAKTSGHPEKRPGHTVSQIAQVQADAPAFIGWLQPLVIWQPNSWHQPIGRPS
jgi:hypothetical protein